MIVDDDCVLATFTKDDYQRIFVVDSVMDWIRQFWDLITMEAFGHKPEDNHHDKIDFKAYAESGLRPQDVLVTLRCYFSLAANPTKSNEIQRHPKNTPVWNNHELAKQCHPSLNSSKQCHPFSWTSDGLRWSSVDFGWTSVEFGGLRLEFGGV